MRTQTTRTIVGHHTPAGVADRGLLQTRKIGTGAYIVTVPPGTRLLAPTGSAESGGAVTVLSGVTDTQFQANTYTPNTFASVDAGVWYAAHVAA